MTYLKARIRANYIWVIPILYLLAMSLSSVSAWSTNTFNNSISSENFTIIPKLNNSVRFNSAYFYNFSNNGSYVYNSGQVGDIIFDRCFTGCDYALISKTCLSGYCPSANGWTSALDKPSCDGVSYAKNDVPYAIGQFVCVNTSSGRIALMKMTYNTSAQPAARFSWDWWDSNTLNYLRYLDVPQNTILTNIFMNLSGFQTRSGLDWGGTGSFVIALGNSTTSNLDCNPGLPNRCGHITRFGNKRFIQGSLEKVGLWIYSPNTAFYGTPLTGNLTLNIRKTSDDSIIDTGNYSMDGFTLDTSAHYVEVNLTGNLIDDEVYLSVERTNDTLGSIGSFLPSSGDNIVSPDYGNAYTYNGTWNLYTELPTKTRMTWAYKLFYNKTNILNNTYFTIPNFMNNYSGNFNQTNNKTINLAGFINSYLGTCSYSSGYCKIPFLFHSDTEGLLQYSNLIFNNIGFMENSQSYNSTTYETSTENFVINFTYDTNYYQVASVNFVYNSVIYSTTVTGSSSNYLARATLDVPLLSGPQQNRSFYWQISLGNSSGNNVFNSISYNQTVKNISLGDCSGALSSTALNITAYDQDTSLNISNWNFQSTLDYFIGTGSIYKTAYFNNVSIAEKDICISNNITHKLTGIISYSATGYQPSTYYFINSPVSNTTTKLNLGLLPTTSNTNFIVQLVNQNNEPVPNYYIYLNRCYASNATNCLVSQIVKTDTNGKSVLNIEAYTVFYQFLVYDTEGNLVYTSDTRKIAPETSPYTITLTIGSSLPNPITYLANLTGLTYSLTYDKDTKLVTLTYTDTNSNFSLAQLYVASSNPSGNITNILCNNSLAGSSGVLNCNVTGNSTGSYTAQFYIYRGQERYFIDNLLFDIESFSTQAGLLGIFEGFCIILLCSFLFSYNEVAGIISVNLGIIFVNLTGLIHFGIIPQTAIIALSIVILIILERS